MNINIHSSRGPPAFKGGLARDALSRVRSWAPESDNMVSPEGQRVTIDSLLRGWKESCKIEKDAHAAISADEGDGKSHLMGQIILSYGGNLWDNVVYTDNPEEYYDKYNALPSEGFILGFDEALGLMNRLDWMKLSVKQLVSHIRENVRKEKHGIFLYAIQLFRDLHGYWRNHRIRYWLELPNREWFAGSNAAFVLKRQRVPFITGKRDTWMLDTQEKVWMDLMQRGEVIGNKYISLLREHPFYMGELRFKALSDRHREQMLNNRIRALEEYQREPETSTRVSQLTDQRNKVMKLAKEAGISPDTIGERIGLSSRQVYKGIEQVKYSPD